MSRAEPFLMTPYSLLKIPEYGRFFDGGPLGFTYRYLRTGVRRQGVSALKFTNPNGWVTELARLYDDGWLASYASLDTLEMASGFSQRSIRNHLKKLEDLKLVRVTPFGDGFVVLMGKRLTFSNSATGLSVGTMHEGFFIDEWESLAETDEFAFRRLLIESLAPKVQAEKFLERLKQDEIEHQGKILHDPVKNFAQNTDQKTDEISRVGQENPPIEKDSRIDKVRIDVNNPATPAGEASALDTMKDASKVFALIKNSSTNDEALAFARDGYANGIPLPTLNQALTVRMDNPRYPQHPRLSMLLTTLEASPKHPHSALGALWAALHEDVTGTVSTNTKKFYKEVVGSYKNSLLKEYSYDQCLWTFHRVMNEGGNIEFLASGGRNLLTVVRQNAKLYQELLDERRRSELESAAAARYEAEQKTRVDKPITEINLTESQKLMIARYEAYAEKKKKLKGYFSGEASA